jgi:hypothetical protein
MTGIAKISFNLFTIFTILVGEGCRQNIENHELEIKDSKAKIVNAKRFRIDQKDGWTEVKIINPWQIGRAHV